ncbi:hypothetical protein MRX96_059464 [Rhipicephalus microplus]
MGPSSEDGKTTKSSLQQRRQEGMIVHKTDENASGKRDSRTVRGLVPCVFGHAHRSPARGYPTDPVRQLIRCYPLTALPLIWLGNSPTAATRLRLSHGSSSATDLPALPTRRSLSNLARQLTRRRYSLAAFRLIALSPIRLGNLFAAANHSWLSLCSAFPLIWLSKCPAAATRSRFSDSRLSHRSRSATDLQPLPTHSSLALPLIRLSNLTHLCDPVTALLPIRLGN